MSGRFAPRALVSLCFLALTALLVLASCQKKGGSGGEGLLASAQPTRAEGVRDAARLTDGVVPAPGSSWNTNRAAIFTGRQALVEFDLGAEKSVEAAALLGDNNDVYVVEGSLDGERFETIWEARPVRAPGLRWRSDANLGKRARYVRLRTSQGDSSLSVAELVLYETAPASLPPRLREVSSLDTGLTYRNTLLVAGAALLLATLGAGPAAPLTFSIALFAFAAWALWAWALSLVEGYPLGQIEVSLTRGVAAALALGVVARETWGSRKLQPFGWFNVGVLSFAALLAVGSFFNMGRPQFFDQKNGVPSVVHNYDMRVYFPVAKYFEELKYDGLYLASVATYAEDHGGVNSPALQSVELRDLKNHRMRPVREVHPELEEVRRRFSPERWRELKEDMRYFWETMGPRQYLGSMADHGGNATPVWLTIAYLMFKSAPASNEVLIATGLLDPLLLLLFAGVVWRTFGVRTALVSLVVYGANDFYMFGSNWAGATLRNDWMVYLGLGACALKVGRFKLGGALLAFSALIRAFPAVALLALAVPVLYALYEAYEKDGKWPDWRKFVASQRWFIDAALGAVVCVVGWVIVSSLVLGWDAWPLWVKKISSFTASPHVNHISLLTVVAGSEGNQQLVLQARRPLFVLASLLYVVLALWAAWKRPPHVAALLGILLLPVFMYPANYYMHFVFLLPLLVDEPRALVDRWAREASGRVWALLLLMCAALYFTVKEQALELHFYNASVILMATLLAVLVVLLPRDAEGYVFAPVDFSGPRKRTRASKIAPREPLPAASASSAASPGDEPDAAEGEKTHRS